MQRSGCGPGSSACLVFLGVGGFCCWFGKGRAEDRQMELTAGDVLTSKSMQTTKPLSSPVGFCPPPTQCFPLFLKRVCSVCTYKAFFYIHWSFLEGFLTSPSTAAWAFCPSASHAGKEYCLHKLRDWKYSISQTNSSKPSFNTQPVQNISA